MKDGKMLNGNHSESWKRVKAFHEAYEVPIRERPTVVGEAERDLRIRLLREEFEEYIDAAMEDDLTEVADALADMVYIIYGTALVYGIPLDEVFTLVHNSNMSKLGPDGKPVYREDGKVMKGPDYEPPAIAELLARYRQGGDAGS